MFQLARSVTPQCNVTSQCDGKKMLARSVIVCSLCARERAAPRQFVRRTRQRTRNFCFFRVCREETFQYGRRPHPSRICDCSRQGGSGLVSHQTF